MNFIIVIKGVKLDEYENIRQDIANQIEAKGGQLPLFAHLPAEYPEIEIVWIDEEMEKENFAKALQGVDAGHFQKEVEKVVRAYGE